ncbi:nitrite/sulfite reductase [Sulfurimonas paralvinellae]|uniref:Nitrite/sulfite reductase n=1 Tax=Sulfurimonas paralvinellae TaxID=317658 RepID=A0A7M1B509_9BACT|nr:nitrite/sulfite reductase [Sulfurimonas paralvinellae]QOP44814.1 nitrite/sulfite reductase [Sulfurimonas paralvinellae]
MSEELEKKLNKREQYKARMKPYDYYTKEFDTIDFDSLGEGDRYYLQDFGIFNTDFLEDEFTIRLRNGDGGHFSAKDFQFLAELVEEYDLTLVITARASFQLHDVYSDDVAKIWHKLNDNNLTTWQSFGDNIRNIVTDVYDGVSKYGHIEAHPIIKQMNDYIIKNPKYVGMLPRRVSIGISGNSANVNSFFANDLYFALAEKDNVYGFNVYMGGKNTEISKDADIFLREEEVFDFFKAFVETFYTHGSRFSRSKTRLFYMIESMGLEKLKELIESVYNKKFVSAGKLQLEHVDFKEFEELRDGSWGFCYQSDFGRIKADELRELSDFVTQNSAQIRIGTDQNIYILGLKDRSVPFSSPALSSTIVACAGNLCPYAVWSIKDEAHEYLPLEKIYNNRIKVGFSGCAKGCGRHRHTDIGLIGLKTNNFGATDGGARIFIGAEHDNGQSVARQLFSMVPFVHLKATVTLVIELFEKSGYQNFQLYAHNILNRYSEDFLALWHLYNLKNKTSHPLPKQSTALTQEEETTLLHEHFEDLALVEDDMKKSVSTMVKELWTVAGEDPHYKPPIERTNFR